MSVIHIGKNLTCWLSRVLDGIAVPNISSQLVAGAERDELHPLASNIGYCSMGSIVSGKGFLLTPEEKEVAFPDEGADVIRPFIGGDEINTSPTQQHHRLAINVSGWPEEKLRSHRTLFEWLDARVRQERDAVGRVGGSWWSYERARADLYVKLGSVSRCLVTPAVSKHVTFAWKSTCNVFAHTLYVFPIDVDSFFATMQSRVFDAWLRRMSSTLEDRAATARMRFTSEAFETFPFPQPKPNTVLPLLETIARALYEARAAYMVETQQGLTQTYNLLKDPACTDSRVEHLRALHVDLDRAVLSAYGWSDIAVPAYTTPTTPAESAALQSFEDAVIDCLFLLNAQRAEAERLAAASSGRGSAKARTAIPRAPSKRKAASKRQLPLTPGKAPDDG